jgi:hypothetical protein
MGTQKMTWATAVFKQTRLVKISFKTTVRIGFATGLLKTVKMVKRKTSELK